MLDASSNVIMQTDYVNLLNFKSAFYDEFRQITFKLCKLIEKSRKKQVEKFDFLIIMN